MVGLISPDMIPNIGSLDKLRAFLTRHGVTHLAVLRNWFEIDNEPLLFSTGEEHPEVVDILPFHPHGSHFVPQDATRARDAARYYYSIGDYGQAAEILRQTVRLDPGSAKTFFWYGMTLLSAGKTDDASSMFAKAIQLYPAYGDAGRATADISLQRGRPEEAIRILESMLRELPGDAEICRALGEIYGKVETDSVKSKHYFTHYADLMRAAGR
jgi:tetratricopeptide (TPR) repeat protein